MRTSKCPEFYQPARTTELGGATSLPQEPALWLMKVSVSGMLGACESLVKADTGQVPLPGHEQDARIIAKTLQWSEHTHTHTRLQVVRGEAIHI